MHPSNRRPSPSFLSRHLCAYGGLLLLFTGAAFAATLAERNFDARQAIQDASPRQQPSPAQGQALDELSRGVAELAVTFDDVTGATRSIYNRAGYLTGPAGGSAEAIARTYLDDQRVALGLAPADLDGMEVSDLVPSSSTGATHLYLRQVYQGIPVYGAQLHVNVNRDGRILSVNNSFLPDLAGAAASARPTVASEQAVAAARQFLGLAGAPGGGSDDGGLGTGNAGTGDPGRPGGGGETAPSVAAELMWLPVRAGEARLVWNFQLATAKEEHVFDLNVDAHTAEVLTSFDMVSDGTYLVYPQPVESPVHTFPLPPTDARLPTVNPEDGTASPLGWHDTGSTAYTIMRGNNVHAYDDVDADNAPPASEPDCGTNLNCIFAINLSGAPSTYVSAAVANLFYWNNILHDVQYQYGFDEEAGNFQVDNFSRGGAGGDDVRAEAQDGGGNCNANFFTPADGSRPRMQMYTCNRATPDRDGDLDAGVIAHEYGHGMSIRQIGGPSVTNCLNNRQRAGEGWSDYMALWYTMEPGDEGTDARGIGNYLVGQDANGVGIRPQQYSTDPAVNTYTYESIDGLSVPHGVGSVWAQVLWEATWALIDAHGFDADLYDVTAGAGNHRAMLYVNEGFKNTVCSPTFVDNRDGLLQAAADNFGGEDVCLLWRVFADFGLGTDAVSGGSGSTTPTNGFSMPSFCASYAVGTVVHDENLRTQAIADFSNPRVVMGPIGLAGADPGTIRVQNVTTTGFQHYLQEWDYLAPGTHSNETVGYLVVENGASSIGSLDVKAGAVTGDHDWQAVSFGTAFSSTPVVLAQVASFNGSQAVTTRIRNVTSSGFEVRLQEEEANDGTHADESIHWVAIETGITTVGSNTFVVARTSNSVTENFATLPFPLPLSNPVFLAAMQTFDGVDPATVRYQNLNSFSVQVQIDEEQSADSEVSHSSEVVGFIAISR